MASEHASKRAAEEEPVTLPVPDFDEVDWKKKEVRGAFQAIVVTAYGFLLGGLGRFAEVAAGDDHRAGWIVLLVGLAGIRLVLGAVKIPAKEFKIKDWLGTYFTLFFSFLAVWYLLSNPPFA